MFFYSPPPGLKKHALWEHVFLLVPVAVFGPSLGHARAHARAAAAAMAAQWRWWCGDWWVWDDNQYDWVHGGPSLDEERAAALAAAAVAAAPKQPAAVPKHIGLPGPPAAAAQPGAGAAVAAGPAAAAGPPAAAAQAAGRHWDIRTQAAGPPAAAQPPGLAYGKTWVQRPSGLWEEAPLAAPGPGPQAAPPAAPQPPGPGAQALPPPALLDYDDLLAANQQQVAPGWIKGASGRWIWADVDGWRWTYARGWRQDDGSTAIIVAATVVAREAREGARWD